MVTRRLRCQGKKRNKEEERSARKEEPVSWGFQPPQNDPSGLPVRLRLPPLCSPPAKALAPVHHLPTYPPTYLPIYLSTCFFLPYHLFSSSSCPDLLTNVPDSTSRVRTRGIPDRMATGHSLRGKSLAKGKIGPPPLTQLYCYTWWYVDYYL